MSRIPVQNLYYLLSYAWDLLSEQDAAPMGLDETRTAPDMLAMMLAGGMETLGRRGLFHNYQPRVEETSRLKGRIDFVGSVRRLQHRQARMVCHFDELGADNLVNGILRATLDRLLGSRSIAPLVRERLRDTSPVLWDVPPVRLGRVAFLRAAAARPPRRYRMILAVCELLYEIAQPDPDGRTHEFVDPWSKEAMHVLFEEFVRNFFTRHLPEASVGGRRYVWDARGDTEEAKALLPTMNTDVTIEWADGSCLVLDCKCYGNSFALSYGQPRIHSANLYQMAAYMHHHPMRVPDAKICGVLLYPAVNAHFLHQYDFMGRRLSVASVDLNQRWEQIHARLLEIVHRACRQPHLEQVMP